jgi:hypothetical protein
MEAVNSKSLQLCCCQAVSSNLLCSTTFLTLACSTRLFQCCFDLFALGFSNSLSLLSFAPTFLAAALPSRSASASALPIMDSSSSTCSSSATSDAQMDCDFLPELPSAAPTTLLSSSSFAPSSLSVSPSSSSSSASRSSLAVLAASRSSRATWIAARYWPYLFPNMFLSPPDPLAQPTDKKANFLVGIESVNHDK